LITKQKIQTRAKFLALFFHISFWFLTATLLLALAMLFFSHYPLTFDTIKSDDNFALSFYYQYSWGIPTETMMKNFTIASLFLYAPFLVILYRTKQLFEKIAQGTPVFDSQIVQQLQKNLFLAICARTRTNDYSSVSLCPFYPITRDKD